LSGGNVHDNKTIALTAISDPERRLKYLADFANGEYYISQNVPHQWICYDLKEMPLLPRGHSIRINGHASAYHLRSWVIEVTNHFDAPNLTEIESAGKTYVTSTRHTFMRAFRYRYNHLNHAAMSDSA
jgi:hypothetical protein